MKSNGIIRTAFFAGMIAATSAYGESITQYVKPFLGTAGHGHTFPGACLPFGMVQVSPDTRDGSWDGCAGYHYADTKILGFSQNHLSGTGAGDLGNVLLMPTVGDVPLEPKDPIAAAFSHEDEVARPGYYSVMLRDRQVKAELTATTRVALHRYTFPATQKAHVVLDLWHGISNNATEGMITIESDHTVSGYRRSKGWGGDKVFYFAIEFSKPFDKFGLEMDGKMTDSKEAKAGLVKGNFDFSTTAGEQVLAKVALSTVDVAGAKRNLQSEMPGWDFDAVSSAANEKWEQALSSASIETNDPVLRETFYSAAYHSMMAPTILNDVDGKVRGPDGNVHEVSGFNFYTELSLWDTFRAENPLLTLTQPARVNDFVKTMLAHFQWFNHKTLPVWTNAGRETWCMIGNHAIPVILNAYQNGFRDWDPQEALSDMVASTTVDRNFLPDYERLGYVPAGEGGPRSSQKRQAVSRTVEYAYDDSCVSRFARALGQTDVADRYAARAHNWKNLYDVQSGFMRPKNADGSWVEGKPGWAKTFDFDYYTEGNAWHYTFFVPQDVPGLMQTMGGEKAFTARLDACFNTKADFINPVSDATGLVGNYAQGNEPCHHMAYLYNYVGQPWRTQEIVRKVEALYSNTNDGLCGNDDCGQTSAWFLFSAIGFYPVDPTSGVYVIGSPLVDRATIPLDPKYYPAAENKMFTVVAENNSPQNIYVQSVTLNGKPLTRSWITAAEVTHGGELHFVMGSAPNKEWGSAPADRPGVSP